MNMESTATAAKNLRCKADRKQRLIRHPSVSTSHLEGRLELRRPERGCQPMILLISTTFWTCGSEMRITLRGPEATALAGTRLGAINLTQATAREVFKLEDG